MGGWGEGGRGNVNFGSKWSYIIHEQPNSDFKDMFMKLRIFYLLLILSCNKVDLRKSSSIKKCVHNKHIVNSIHRVLLYSIVSNSNIQVFFLWKLLYLGCTDVTSFCMQFEKSRHGLLREAFRSEGEWASGCKREG